MPHKYISDQPTLDERLGRIDLLREVYERVTDQDVRHGVIGIHGDWGSGKTSFLMQLEYLLTKGRQQCGQQPPKSPDETPCAQLLEEYKAKPTYPVVWFEAWRYQNDDQPVVTLLQEIRKQMAPVSKGFLQVKKEVAVALETALLGVDELTKKFGVRTSPSEIRGIGERYETANFEAPSMTVSVTAILNHTVDAIVRYYAKNGKADRLVVLIDDLDRCDPEMAQKLLEGLKIFLNLQNVVFVIAMDETVIEEYIAKQLFGKAAQDGEEARKAQGAVTRRARQYLEKLCQSIYVLPFAVDPEKLFIELLEQYGCDLAHLADLGPVLTMHDAVPPNPRRIRHLVDVTNRLLRRLTPEVLAKYDVKGQRVLRVLAYILAYLQQFEPNAHRLLQRYGAAFYSDFLIPVCRNEEPEVQAEGVSLPLPNRLLDKEGTFYDPIRSGVFYPAGLVLELQIVQADLDVFFR